jgi:hypothetical protein
VVLTTSIYQYYVQDHYSSSNAYAVLSDSATIMSVTLNMAGGGEALHNFGSFPRQTHETSPAGASRARYAGTHTGNQSELVSRSDAFSSSSPPFQESTSDRAVQKSEKQAARQLVSHQYKKC